jgi:hypothetical protein
MFCGLVLEQQKDAVDSPKAVMTWRTMKFASLERSAPPYTGVCTATLAFPIPAGAPPSAGKRDDGVQAGYQAGYEFILYLRDISVVSINSPAETDDSVHQCSSSPRSHHWSIMLHHRLDAISVDFISKSVVHIRESLLFAQEFIQRVGLHFFSGRPFCWQ